MLEFLRKHQGTLWIAVTAVVIISFTFWGGYTQSKNSQHASPEDTAFTIYGKSYSYLELDRLRRYFTLASMLQLTDEATGQSFPAMITHIARRFQTADQVQPDFAFNLLVLRNEVSKAGIHVSDAEVQSAYNKLPVLQTNGQYDVTIAKMVDERLGSLGFSNDQLYDLVRDWIAYQKLQELVAGNFVPSPNLTTHTYASQYQTVKAANITFPLETFQKAAKVNDEEIAKYYEEKKDTFKTVPKRAVEYVLIAKPDTSKVNVEDTLKANNEYGKKVQEFSDAVAKPGADFAAEAAKAKAEVKKLAAFEQDTPPAELKDEAALISEIFSTDPKLHPVSEPVEGSKGYYLFKITEDITPQQQALADVKEKIRETLVNQKAREEMAKAANDARKKLEDLLKEGKKFDEAVKTVGLKSENLPEFSAMNPLGDLSNGREIAMECLTTAPGGFTKPMETPSGLFLVHVISKELQKRPTSGEDKERVSGFIESALQSDVFQAWFDRRREEAKVDADPLIRRTLGNA